MENSISVVVKLNDEISKALKSITNTTKGCSKAMEELEKKGQNLGARYKDLVKRSAEAEAAALDIKRAMDEAKKSFLKTGDEADALKASLAGQEYEDYRRKLEAINKTMKETEKQIQSVSGAAGDGPGRLRRTPGKREGGRGRTGPDRRHAGADVGDGLRHGRVEAEGHKRQSRHSGR